METEKVLRDQPVWTRAVTARILEVLLVLEEVKQEKLLLGTPAPAPDRADKLVVRMTDADEANPVPQSPSPPGSPADPNQALVIQAPSARFATIFSQAVEQIEGDLEEDMALFWSGGGKPTPDGMSYEAKADLIARTSEYVDSNSLWQSFHLGAIDLETLGEGEKRELTSIYSAAIARAAAGKVHLMVPLDGLMQTTTWTSIEWPEILRDGNKVSQLIYFEPQTGMEGWLLWDRIDGYTGNWPIGVAHNDGAVFPLGKPAGPGVTLTST